MPNERIYLDYASTTPCDPTVITAMAPFWSADFGNPSSIHQEGVTAKKAVETATESIAQLLQCKPSQLIFTGNATESCNLAIRGTAYNARKQDPSKTQIVTSAIEHKAVLDTCASLESEGFQVTYITPTPDGRIRAQAIKDAITDSTCLVSIMHGNNEIGTIQPIRKISTICKEQNIPLHTDACQTAPYLSVEPERLGVDLLTLNGSKLYGPKGIGLLYSKDPTLLQPIITGGSQQQNLRAGTLPVPLIIGLAKAMELQWSRRSNERERLYTLRTEFIHHLIDLDANITGSEITAYQLPHIVHVTFDHKIDGQTLALYLDAKGIACATGSACGNSEQSSSHVLQALDIPPQQALTALRFSMGCNTTQTQINQTIVALKEILTLLC